LGSQAWAAATPWPSRDESSATGGGDGGVGDGAEPMWALPMALALAPDNGRLADYFMDLIVSVAEK
jgi:hypothetical protein